MKSQNFFRQWQESKSRTKASTESIKQFNAVTDQDAEAELDGPGSLDAAIPAASYMQRLSWLEEKVTQIVKNHVDRQDMQDLRDEINEWTSEAERQIQGLVNANRK